VAAIKELHPEHSDFAGGIAPRTLHDHGVTDRHRSTIHRHLEADPRVTRTRGVMRGVASGGPRDSYVPVGGDDAE
jgi:hypothetical protein